ncbi:MAG: OsmC family peroxiredoxin [Actinomycetes bacterium]
MATTSNARTHWEGPLTSGSGTTELVTSGVATFDVSWAARTDSGQGTTNPEELVAAALSTCFSMALSHALAGNDTPPASLDTEVGVTFVPGTGITGATIKVTGDVPGLDAEQFQKFAEDTKVNCPVSKALAGVDKTLEAVFVG